MSEKNQIFVLRLSSYEAEQLKYVSSVGKISQAEVLRVGLQMILCKKPPCEVPQLEKFYEEVADIEY